MLWHMRFGFLGEGWGMQMVQAIMNKVNGEDREKLWTRVAFITNDHCYLHGIKETCTTKNKSIIPLSKKGGGGGGGKDL